VAVAVALLVPGFALGGSAQAFIPPPSSYATQVTTAEQAGAAYLVAQQGVGTTPGCWTSSGYTTGVTALAMLAIIHSQPAGYASLSPAYKTAVDNGTSCLLAHVITTPAAYVGTIDDGAGFLATYSTSISIWALSNVPSTGAVSSAIAGGRTWLLANQCNDGSGRADAGGNVNNGGWTYEDNTNCSSSVEHSNSSFALQGLAASPGGIPAATANLAQGFWTCLQRLGPQLPHCSPPGGLPDNDGGFIYYHLGAKGGTETSATGSGSFALSLTGVLPSDPRIVASLAWLDQSLIFSPCSNNIHTVNSLLPPTMPSWSPLVSGIAYLTHYADWTNLKAHKLALVLDDVNDPSNWYYKLANCLTNEQLGDGHFPASYREDDILATSFAVLTLEQVTPVAPGSITICKQTDPPGSTQGFTFDWSAPPIAFTLPFSLHDGGPCFIVPNASPGSYTFSEHPTPGWALTNIVCTGGSSIGFFNSPSQVFVLPLFKQGDTGVRINLASGENVTCTFFNTYFPCAAPGGLDISTGSKVAFTQNNNSDLTWTVNSGQAHLAIPTDLEYPGGWVTPPPGSRWIHASSLTAESNQESLQTYVYEAKFTVPNSVSLRLRFQWAADNNVTFELFNSVNALVATNPLLPSDSPLNIPPSNWNMLHPAAQTTYAVFITQGGQYTLRATVGNPDAPTPSGLLVAGTVSCRNDTDVGGIVGLTVSSSGSPFSSLPLAAVAASVMALLAVSGWYGRRRWLR
jgi:hypothetical protein